MATVIDLARGWMQKSDSDRLNAERTTQSSGPYDTACFHAQQPVEKYLKAILALSGTPMRRTHDLAGLYGHCQAIAPDLSLDLMELSILTPYAVLLRYDVDFWPDRATAEEALATVARVRAAVLTILPPEAHPD